MAWSVSSPEQVRYNSTTLRRPGDKGRVTGTVAWLLCNSVPNHPCCRVVVSFSRIRGPYLLYKKTQRGKRAANLSLPTIPVMHVPPSPRLNRGLYPIVLAAVNLVVAVLRLVFLRGCFPLPEYKRLRTGIYWISLAISTVLVVIVAKVDGMPIWLLSWTILTNQMIKGSNALNSFSCFLISHYRKFSRYFSRIIALVICTNIFRANYCGIPTSKEALYREIQRLWDQVDLCDYRKYIERLTCKLEDMIEVRGLATIH